MTEHTPSAAEPPSSESPSSQPSDFAASDFAALQQPDPVAAIASPAAGRGWPWWAWTLLIGAPLLFLSCIGAALFANILVGQATQALICYADGYCGFGGGAVSTPAATEPPVDRDAAPDRVTLDGHAVFDGQPEWSIQLEPSWQAITFDQDGFTVFRDEATGCQLIALQSLALPNPDALSDAEVSTALLFREIAGFTADDPEALILNRGVTDIAIAAADSGTTIEFAAATVFRTSPEGVSESIEIAVRSMPDSQIELVAALTCDTDVLETFDSKYELFSDALAVTTRR